jgi:hypothetical protein
MLTPFNFSGPLRCRSTDAGVLLSLLRSHSASSPPMELCRGSSPTFQLHPVFLVNSMQSPTDVVVGMIPYNRNAQTVEFHSTAGKKNNRPKMACHQCRDRKVKVRTLRFLPLITFLTNPQTSSVRSSQTLQCLLQPRPTKGLCFSKGRKQQGH